MIIVEIFNHKFPYIRLKVPEQMRNNKNTHVSVCKGNQDILINISDKHSIYQNF